MYRFNIKDDDGKEPTLTDLPELLSLSKEVDAKLQEYYQGIKELKRIQYGLNCDILYLDETADVTIEEP